MDENKVIASVKAILNPSIKAKALGIIGRGVTEVGLNADGELEFVMSDGKAVNLGKLPTAEIPIADADTLGGIKVGGNLLISADGTLSVDTASAVQQDNTRPVTSGAVYLEIGNIEALLNTI